MEEMTERFYREPYCREFQAVVTACEKRKNGWAVALDDTAFYPEGGGQPADHGTLHGIAVTDVHEKDGIVLHYAAAPLAPGTSVHGGIDWERRFDHMQQHSGEHIISGLICERFHCDNVGFHLGEKLVTIDYNAAFVGAAAGLYHFYGKDTDKIDVNFPPEDVYQGDDENGGKGYWVEAFTVDDPTDDGAGCTKVSFLVRTAEPAPADQISVRYYFDASEIKNIGLVKANQAYDQSESEDRAAGGDGIITETPVKYDKKDNTYYIEN